MRIWYDNLDFFSQEQQAIAQAYPGLSYFKRDGTMLLQGNLIGSYSYADETIDLNYRLRFDFPNNYPKKAPTVKEIDGQILPTYPHRNKDQTLCLATNPELYRIFSENRVIGNFIQNLVVPALYAHAYYVKHGKFPWPDAPHGERGIFEEYTRIFSTTNQYLIIQILAHIAKPNRISQDCACGSGKKFKSCHINQTQLLRGMPTEAVETDLRYLIYRYQTLSEARAALGLSAG